MARSRAQPTWLPWSVYGALGALGAALSWYQRGEVWRAPSGLRLSRDPGMAELLGVGLALLVTAVTVLSTRWLVEHAAWARALHTTLRGPLLGASAGRLLLLATLASCAEEVFFRAALFPSLGLFESSLVFGALHIAPRAVYLPWMLWATLMGVLFALLFVASGSLLAPLLAHAAINFQNMRYLRGFEPTGAERLSLPPHRERWRRL
ncbi:MAG: hypothetical protein JWN48_2681 [Myxococcaceae bacterium]|nr:hypothetical protein [Myxococcaceae bacterium]